VSALYKPYVLCLVKKVVSIGEVSSLFPSGSEAASRSYNMPADHGRQLE
jgi:hypothetical protein